MGKIYIVGTCDTKLAELKYLQDVINSQGVSSVLVDVGTKSSGTGADVSAKEVASYYSNGEDTVLGGNDRGVAVGAMSEAIVNYVKSRDDIAGIVSIGGSGGTALVTPAMQALPVGLPKLMVSTVASGNVGPYVGPSDISMMYSVVDVAGLNSVLTKILSNAAGSIVGMVKQSASQPPQTRSSKPAIGMTMFGVTTACVDAVAKQLENDYDCLVFHATGTGGQSMEKLVANGMISGVLDITTTEVCDYMMGGVMQCLPTRFDVFAETKVPYVGSVGALDMVNFGARDTVPEEFSKRNLYVHNAQVTLMRTTAEENAKMGKWIAQKLNKMDGPVRFLLPLGGVSAIDVEGMPFLDKEADKALFDVIEGTFEPTENRKLIRVDAAINDPEFSDTAVAAFKEIIN